SIIWCDSRAVEIGGKAFESIGEERCLTHLLNSPGNFTASKLAWIKQFLPDEFEKIDKIMLPGDFISMKLTGEITTSISSLSEGVFWDFKEGHLSDDVMDYYQFDRSIIPAVQDVFSDHGHLKPEIASILSLKPGIPVTYKAGDQPNNALSLNVMEPGEVAATAGTSGVIYGVTDQLVYDKRSRVNSFAHVNHSPQQQRIGVLLCINGTGILNRWMKTTLSPSGSYQQMNEAAGRVAPGSEGLRIIPFGNGAERMLENRQVGAQIRQLDLNLHGPGHMYRAAQEGIAFAFRYGLDILRENGMNPSIIRAGKANLFLSEVFVEAFVNATGVPVEMYNSDGSAGAAIGSGIGVKAFNNAKEAFQEVKSTRIIEPAKMQEYNEFYQDWLRFV
ncbi:MAG: FGGY family carbohydrate kinase, partial [Chitinophagaceae bacterium]